MRGAPGRISGSLIAYTTIGLPEPGGNARDGGGVGFGGPEVYMPLWGGSNYGDPAAPRRALEASA